MPARNMGNTPKKGTSPSPGENTPQKTTDTDIVLKPLFGMAPGQYLFILYLALGMALLFAIFILPGLLKPGMRVRVSSNPVQAAVRLDDVYRGPSPCTIFVPKGAHRITVVAPGFEAKDIAVESRARVFASLFRPPVHLETVSLVPQEPLKALAAGAAEYAAWSLAGKPDESWQIPLVLSEAAWRMGPFLMDTADDSHALLYAVARFARWPQQHRDLLRAAFLLEGGGLPPSPLATITAGQRVLRWLSDTPTAALALAESLESDSRQQLLASPWYAKAASRSTPQPQWRAGGESLTVGALVFSKLTDNSGVQADWWIARDEISIGDWNDFIRENPEWSPDNRDKLREEGLVNDSYLDGYQGVSWPGESRHSVSWYAANVYCQWLERRLPPRLSGYEVRLPRESEWENAAALAGPLSLENMSDGLWEWCEDPWSHYPSFAAPQEAIDDIASPLRSLRGGSWANRSGERMVNERGAQLPETCSPFTGFRPVIVKRPGGETP